MTNDRSNLSRPLKSVAGSLLFTAILGPVGLLYASFWGAVFMILISAFIVPTKMIVPIAFIWVICCIWGVGAAERHNRRVLSSRT